MIPKEADKNVGNTTSALCSTVRKGVGDANKSTWKIKKGVVDKVTHSFGRDVQSNKVLISHFPNILFFYFITNFLFPPIK